MASEERETPQIRNVYELLIMSHPSYNHFQIIDNWAYAQKLPESSTNRDSIERVIVIQKKGPGLSSLVEKILKKIVKR